MHLALWSYSNQVNTYTLTLGSGGTARVLTPYTDKLGSGFALRLYSFTSDANTGGAALTLTVPAANGAAIRFGVIGSSFTGTSSPTPLAFATTPTPSTTATRDAPALTGAALNVPHLYVAGVVSQIGTGLGVSSWVPAAGLTTAAQQYDTTITPRLAQAQAIRPGISPAGDEAARTWSALDNTATASPAFSIGYALAYPLSQASLTNYRWDPAANNGAGAWVLMAAVA